MMGAVVSGMPDPLAVLLAFIYQSEQMALQVTVVLYFLVW